jgi:hypothetical protein
MFNNPTKIDYSLDEGTVTEVDVLRKMCRVKTLSGQNLNGVQWLQPKGGSTRGDDSCSPELGDRCVINSGLGYPLIIGYLPRLQNMDNAFPVNIDQDEELIDTGDFSTAPGSVTFSQNAPRDRALGDRLFTSVGGGLVGLLRGGSVLLRSSRLSEIFLSKWDDVVRIVARNYEHYTDVSSSFYRNLKGRVYRYSGYSNNLKDAKQENYKYNEYYGDVAIAEKAKTDLTSEENPAKDDRVYKEEIVTGVSSTDKQLMYREIHLDGTTDLKVISQDGTLVTQIKSRNNDVLVTATSGDGALFSKALFTKSDVTIVASDNGGTFTKTYMTKDEVKTSFKDQNVVKINTSQINLNFNGGADVNMTASGIKSVFSSGTVDMTSSGVKTTFGGAVCDVSNSGVNCTYSGHFMKVTAGGVQLG